MDLNPYGHVPPANRLGPIVTYDDPALAVGRAQYKLQQWREGRNLDLPVGAALWWPSLVIFCGMAELVFGGAYWAYFKTPLPMLVSGPLALYLLVHGWRTIMRSRAREALDCMREFVHCTQRGDLGRAWSLIAPVDRDNYTRAAPTAREHDPTSVKRFAFDSRAGFAAYWASARALGVASRLRLRISGPVQFLAPDMALVPIEVHVQQSMRLERERKSLSIRKLVLRHGDEWRVFDGEVASAAELDQQWLIRPAAQIFSPTPNPQQRDLRTA